MELLLIQLVLVQLRVWRRNKSLFHNIHVKNAMTIKDTHCGTTGLNNNFCWERDILSYEC